MLNPAWKRIAQGVYEAARDELGDARVEYRNLSPGADTVLEIAEMKGETVGQPRNALRIAARGTFEDKPFVVSRAEIARELLADGRGADQSAHQVSLEGNLSANRIMLNANVIDLFTCKV